MSEINEKNCKARECLRRYNEVAKYDWEKGNYGEILVKVPCTGEKILLSEFPRKCRIKLWRIEKQVEKERLGKEKTNRKEDLWGVLISAEDGVNAVENRVTGKLVKELSMFAYEHREEYGLSEEDFE